MPPLPTIACLKPIGLHPFHGCADNCVDAAAKAAEGLPVIVPLRAERAIPTHILDGLGGTFSAFASSMPSFMPWLSSPALSCRQRATQRDAAASWTA